MDPRCQIRHSAVSERLESATKIVVPDDGTSSESEISRFWWPLCCLREPEYYVDDLRTKFGESGGAFRVVKGCSGFDAHKAWISPGKPMT